MTPRQIPTFLHIPKTGGSTLNYLLRRSFGIRHVDVDPLAGHSGEIHPEDLILVRRAHPLGIVSLAGHGFRPQIDLASSGIVPEYYTILREPVARSISWYVYRVLRCGQARKDPVDFFSRKGPQNFQTKRLAGEANLDKAIETLENSFRFAGLLERFDDSLRLLRHSFPDWGLDIRYRPRNVASDNPLKWELKENRVLLDLLEETNQLDRRLCRYVEKRYFSESAPPRETGVDSLLLTGHAPSLSVGANRLVRNAIYKPAVRVARAMSK